eukprot:Lithocolla_globosa_v1_NODE_1014_length_2958_cov_1.873103.p3 type:complete len:145 gc:universal NODE_1014_length_2958_cov_1.873103:106-540(+)
MAVIPFISKPPTWLNKLPMRSSPPLLFPPTWTTSSLVSDTLVVLKLAPARLTKGCFLYPTQVQGRLISLMSPPLSSQGKFYFRRLQRIPEMATLVTCLMSPSVLLRAEPTFPLECVSNPVQLMESIESLFQLVHPLNSDPTSEI